MQGDDAPVFYLPPEQWGDPLVLAGPEAVHAVKVLRLISGGALRLTDGHGRMALCRIESAAKSGLTLHIQRLTRDERPDARLHLAPGFCKSARRGYLIEKAAELGAAGLVFWQAARSQGRVPDAAKDNWLTQAVSGAKQSARAFVPDVGVAVSLEALIARADTFDHRFVALEPRYDARALTVADMRRPGDALLVLGPEGGLTDAEAQTLVESGFSPVSLGPGLLRLETAALAALCLWHWALAGPEVSP